MSEDHAVELDKRYTVKELQAMLTKSSLPTHGKKDELIKRLISMENLDKIMNDDNMKYETDDEDKD